MSEGLELLENVRAEVASEAKLFGGEGQRVRGRASEDYTKRLMETINLYADVMSGKKPSYHLREAMTQSDFPYLFGDVLDRQLLAAYQEFPATYRNYVRVATVNDFRQVKRFSVYGADQVLGEVGEAAEYPESPILENSPYTYQVTKYGRKVAFSWEALINDDLNALRDIPVRLGRAARRSEQKFVTGLYCDSSGPHASFYTSGNKNIVTSNPVLSTNALQTAMKILSEMKDENGEPIYIDAVELVVPPALEITALNIMNATNIWLDPNASSGTAKQTITAVNWMKNRVRLNVDPYIPVVATSNGDTSWFLFANPASGQPALEMGFLRGHEQPEVFVKTTDAQRVGGGNDMNVDFDTDGVQYKVRHVFGGSRMSPKVTVASKGTGS